MPRKISKPKKTRMNGASKKAKKVDATRLLKQDHTKVKALFEELENLTGRATAKRRNLFDQLKTELDIHARIEEEIFYPAVRGLRSKDAKERVNEANEEHALVKMLLKQTAELGTDDETFKAKIKVLKDLVLHHAREEEKEMFAEAKDGFSKEELEELGARLEERKDHFLTFGITATPATEADLIEEEDEADYEEPEDQRAAV